MHTIFHPRRRLGPVRLSVMLVASLALTATVQAQIPKPFTAKPLHLFKVQPTYYGPYSGVFLFGGKGLVKPLHAQDPVFSAKSAWTLTAWVKTASTPDRPTLVAGVGDTQDPDARFFALVDHAPALWLGPGRIMHAGQPWTDHAWHFLAATFAAGRVHFYVDGKQVAQRALQAGPVQAQIAMAPDVAEAAASSRAHFGGRVALLTLRRQAYGADRIAHLAQQRPDVDLIHFEDGSKPWPLESVQWIGYRAPQDPYTLPHSRAPFSKPRKGPAPAAATTLRSVGQGRWELQGGWKLAFADKVQSAPAQIAGAGLDTHDWLPAQVPGTVLGTLVNRGIYPNPYYGLDNLAIPESLNKHDYWYRNQFKAPAMKPGQRMRLILDGVNYRAQVWFNGQRLGRVTGAFIHGGFDVTSLLRPGAMNTVAIRVSPAPHPGIPYEKSLLAGNGLNGGPMCLDGPTFMASEGWDWIPPIRDRDTGLWRPVELHETGGVRILPPQVITRLPLPDISQAYVTVRVPLRNQGDAPLHGTLTMSFEGVSVKKQVTLPAGRSTVTLTPADYAQLHLLHPRLWWPNGYGKPALYHMQLAFAASDGLSDQRRLQFGVREVSYELSLLDNSGHLRRLVYDPTLARTAKTAPVDVSHQGIREIPGGWASSIAAGRDDSPAFHTLHEKRRNPDLILRVNGVRIAARGGNWGMDDAMKGLSDKQLEPFFRLEHDAHINIIRNWQGQNTEPAFYRLADKYGLMVWNDFWEVTEESNLEAQDPQLFLKNARDVIRRYRNHPSIVMWNGRNEGVPQPIINEGLARLVHRLDGTRYYSPSSNKVNLEPSGPYGYQPPQDYFTKLNPGFAVETGTPSIPTLEWFSRWMPKADRWPVDDVWAYHNFQAHDDFNATLQRMFGAADSLDDFVRKAQMLNYIDFRSVFEGFNAHLWQPNGGRLLWMTQPAWPSMLWGIVTSDYDAPASFYGVQKALEPLHAQYDLASGGTEVINTTRAARHGLTLQARVYDLAGRPLYDHSAKLDVDADAVRQAFKLPLAGLMHGRVVLLELDLRDASGRSLSRNLYWQAEKLADYRAMDRMPQSHLGVQVSTAAAHGADAATGIDVRLTNRGKVPALAAKLTLFDASTHKQVLPAYFSDNYVSLLPGEHETVHVDVPASSEGHRLQLQLRGWNIHRLTQSVPR